MIDSTEYKIHPEAFKLMKKALESISNNMLHENKPHLVEDMVFASLFLYARRIGTDREHIDFLSKKLTLDTLSLTELFGAIDKYQKELGV